MKEHQHTEWKETWRDEYLRWICGFANAEGGTLHIGRNDKGVVVGVSNAAKLLQDIPNKVRDILGIMVDVNLREKAGKEWIEIRVEPYPSPISYRGEYHYRSGSTKQELKGAALDKFLLRKQGRHWDGVPLPGFSNDQCSGDALRYFKEQGIKSGRLDASVKAESIENILEKLQLTEAPYLKRSAALLFGKAPENNFTGAYIKVGFFVTDDNLLYQDVIGGNLFEQVEKSLEVIYFKYLKASIRYEGLQRIESYPFPQAALREALLNAVIHKDYSSGIPIQISVYDDRLVLWNPGQLPVDWTLARLLGKHPSNPYNPLLANAFFLSGYIESWGRGIEKIAHECEQHGIHPPDYDSGMSGLMVTFHASEAYLALINPKPAKLLPGGATNQEIKKKGGVKTLVKTRVETRVKTPGRILVLLAQSPEMTLADVAAKIGKSLSAVERASAKLVKAGKLKHEGPQKGGHWKIIK
jgi:ATP-dependent DNA helicase RecG